MITASLLKSICKNGRQDIIDGFAECADALLAKYEINTPLRLAHFWTQIAHESDGMRTMTEYASGREYEGRGDLGNINPGDGPLFKGRGPFQLTGRFNYMRMGHILGIDLVDNPEKAAEPAIGLEIACIYWQQHNLNHYADMNNIDEITLRINGGYNGLASRQAYYTLAKNAFKDQTIASSKIDLSPKDIQTALNKAGANPQLIVDGNIGPASIAAIEAFQTAHKLTPDGIPGPLTMAALAAV